MDNKSIATVLYETADLLEIDGQDSFRIRSYRNAAQAIENLTDQIRDIIAEPKKVLAIPGIGKGMLLNLQELLRDGALSMQAELLKKYHPSMLQLLKIQGLGPKTIALIWSAYQVSDVDGVEKLAREGKIRELPRMGEKHEQKLLKAIEDYRRISGRFLIDAAETEAKKLSDYLAKFPGFDRITPAGSLRRGRETVGDLDILVTGAACCSAEEREKAVKYIAQYPPLMSIIAQGDNKISFRLRTDMQVDVRLLPPNRSAQPCSISPDPKPTMLLCGSALSGWVTRSTSTAWPISRRRSLSRARLKKRSTPSSISIMFLPSCVKILARLIEQKDTRCPL